MVRDLPLKEKPKPKAKERMYYLVCSDLKGLLYIKKREAGIWKGLYEFPLLLSKKKLKVNSVLENVLGLGLKNEYTLVHVSKEIKHLLSHKELTIQFIRLEIQQETPEFISDCIPVHQKEIITYPFPAVILEYLRKET